MNEKKLPKAGAKRYGHGSSQSGGRMTRALNKGGYFDRWLKRARKVLKIK